MQSRGDRGRRWQLHRLDRLGVGHLPFALKVLLENLLRHEDGRLVTAEQVEAVRRWDPAAERPGEVDLHPTRVFLHDTNGGARRIHRANLVGMVSCAPAWTPDADGPRPQRVTTPGSEEADDALAEQLQLRHLVGQGPDEDPPRAGSHEGGQPLGAHLRRADEQWGRT